MFTTAPWSTDRRSRGRREEGVRHEIVKRLAASALVPHEPPPSAGVRDVPLGDMGLKQFVDKILEPFGEAAPAPAGSERVHVPYGVIRIE